MDLETLNGAIASCRNCALSGCRTNAVPGEGPIDAEIMLVGEAPGSEEDLTGRPFVGRCGRLLSGALDMAGIDRRKVFITSIIKCRPPDNRLPKKAEIAACMPHLRAQIEQINPRIICLMGNTAIRAVLKSGGVTSIHGKVYEDRFLVTFHPAAVLRNRNLKDSFVSDLRKLKLHGVESCTASPTTSGIR